MAEGSLVEPCAYLGIQPSARPMVEPTLQEITTFRAPSRRWRRVGYATGSGSGAMPRRGRNGRNFGIW